MGLFDGLEDGLAEVFKAAALATGDSELLAMRRAHPAEEGQHHKDIHPAHIFNRVTPDYEGMKGRWEERQAALEQMKRMRKTATLGTAVVSPRNVGKLRGMMTTHAMKAPGYAASTQAMNPTRNVISAMNKFKPH